MTELTRPQRRSPTKAWVRPLHSRGTSQEAHGILNLWFVNARSKPIEKRLKVNQLLNKCDFLCVQETFATKGCEIALKPPAGTTTFWSHLVVRPGNNCTVAEPNGKIETRRGGLALIIKKDFLAKFNCHTWEEVIKGKVAVLHLIGDSGALDICAFTCQLVAPRGVLNAF